MAAFLRRTLKIDVDLVPGRYGEFKVFVDGSLVVDGGSLAALGVLPSRRKIVGQVRAAFATRPTDGSTGAEG